MLKQEYFTIALDKGTRLSLLTYFTIGPFWKEKGFVGVVRQKQYIVGLHSR